LNKYLCGRIRKAGFDFKKFFVKDFSDLTDKRCKIGKFIDEGCKTCDYNILASPHIYSFRGQHEKNADFGTF